MNIQKTITIIAAILINCAALAWFHSWSATAAAGTAAAAYHSEQVVTLPEIKVHPSPAQLRELHRSGVHDPQPSGSGGGVAYLVMPFYSFASCCDASES